MKQSAMNFPELMTERYRPHRVDDFVGLPKVKAVVKAFLRAPRPCGWLFLGPSGRGKTAMALAICESMKAELHHVPSKECDIEKIRELSQTCFYVPMNGMNSFHIIVIDETDKATKDAQMALLSKLDGAAPLPRTIFIFTANDTTLLEPRFLSRLMILNFDAEGMPEELPRYLQNLAKREGLKYKLDFEKIARDTNFNVRDAMTKLELEIMGAGYLKDGYMAGDLKASKRKAA